MKPWEEDQLVELPEVKEKPWEKDEVVQDESTFGDYARGAAGGFNRGLITQMLGAPVDITNAILGAVGLGSEKPVGGSESMREALPGSLFPEPPDTGLGRGIARVGEEVGASVVPAGGILRAARGAAAVAPRTGSLVNRVVQGQILDPIRRAPGKAALGELTAATGAGAGAAVAREVAPGSSGAETTGQLVGGIAPAATSFVPSVVATRAIREFTSRFSTKAQTMAAKSAVSKIMGKELTQTARKNIEESGRLVEKIPGLKPSVPEATGSPSLIAQQRQLESQAQGEVLEGFIARRTANEEAIKNFTDKSSPKGDVDVEYVVDAAKNRVDAVGDTITRLEGKNLADQKKLAGTLLKTDRISTGVKMREALVAKRAEISVKMSQRAKELGINDADMDAPYSEWRNLIIEKYEPESRFFDKGNMPKIYKEILADKPVKPGEVSSLVDSSGRQIKAPDTEVKTTFQDVKTLRERVTDDLIDEIGGATPSRVKIRFLTRLKKDVDGLVDSLGDIGPNYKQFREEYFNEYIKPFEQGAVFKIKDKGGQGFYRSRDESVAGMFFDNESAARQFQTTFGADPAMMKSMEGAVLDNMRDAVIRDGIVDQKLLNSWVNKNRKALSEIPKISAKVDNFQAAQSSLIDRQVQLVGRRINIENNSLSKQLARFEGGNQAADKILNDALKNPKRMQSLMSFVKSDEAATNALKRTVWDKAVQGDSTAVLKFMKENEGSLRELYGNEHLQNMHDISLARAMVERVPSPAGKAYAPRPGEEIEKILGQGIPQVGSRVFAWKSGRMQKGYLALDTAMRVIRGRASNAMKEVYSEALYNPNVAKELAEGMRDEFKFPAQKTAKRLNARLFALGIPYLREEKQGETK